MAQRYFKYIDPVTDLPKSAPLSGTPKLAASKAFTKRIREIRDVGGDNTQPIKISLIETTIGCSRQRYHFICKRVPLENPQSITIMGKTITYFFKNDIIEYDPTTEIQDIDPAIDLLTNSMEDLDVKMAVIPDDIDKIVITL